MARTRWKSLACLALIAFALTGYRSSANALPSDPCNVAAVPPAIGDGTVSITVPKQPPRGWQRQGGNIEISIVSPKVPPKANIFVCFRWKLDDPNAADEKYKKFVASGIVSGSIPSDKPSGPLTITASVPTALPPTPTSLRSPTPGLPLGVYALNNQFPVADVRVLLYGDSDVPALDFMSVFGVIGADVFCDMPLMGTNSDSGIGSLGEHKIWQPIGGEFEFTVKATRTIPANAPVLVCFRWKLERGDPRRFYDSGPTHIVDRQPDIIKVAATARPIRDEPDWWPSASTGKTVEPRVGTYAIPYIGLVPLADARILIVDTDGSPIVDVLTTVGITNVYFAGIITVLTLVVAFYVLLRICRSRLKLVPQCGPLLCTITTRRGYASLSQFQIILWTFVVIASAAYVMSLSGDLIAISTGTLVLLGISGSAAVISKAKGEFDVGPPPTLDPAAAAAAAEAADREAQRLRSDAALTTGEAKQDADAAAKEATANAEAAMARAAAADAVAKATRLRREATAAPADQAAAAAAKTAEDDAQDKLKQAAIAEEKAKKAIRHRHPRWSDLVMEEVAGRELDVTRVQMLYFTLVTAAFVLLKVITSYEIPVIPEGFLILMGISNSVYVGSKFATNPAAK